MTRDLSPNENLMPSRGSAWRRADVSLILSAYTIRLLPSFKFVLLPSTSGNETWTARSLSNHGLGEIVIIHANVSCKRISMIGTFLSLVLKI